MGLGKKQIKITYVSIEEILKIKKRGAVMNGQHDGWCEITAEPNLNQISQFRNSFKYFFSFRR